MKRTNRPDETGISLVELMTVIAIIAVMAFFAGPEMLNIGPKAKMKSAARDLKSNLEMARMEAVKRNKPVNLVFTPSTTPGASAYEIKVDENRDGTGDLSLLPENSAGVEKYTFPGTVLLESVKAGGTAATSFFFDPRGFWFKGNTTSRQTVSETIFTIKSSKPGTYTVKVNSGGSGAVSFTP